MSDVYYDGLREELAKFVPDGCAKVLEVGCGKGLFRGNFTEGNEYWGIEPEPHIASDAEQKLDRVLVGTYQEVEQQVPDHYFDLVVCNDVIEHMVDHESFLLAISKKMTSGGSLIGSIPNVRYIANLKGLLLDKDWAYQKSGILDRTHLRFFTLRSLQRTFDTCNYHVEIMEGVNPWAGSTLFKSLACSLASRLLGDDIRFLQFAFRVQPRGERDSA